MTRTSIGFNGQTGADFMDLQNIIDTLTKCAQLWETLLFSSGGALELSKCYYQMVHWAVLGFIGIPTNVTNATSGEYM